MRKPEISIIMPVYNMEEYVGEAIRSMLEQTNGDFEFLIFNDGSTDRSLEVIKKYKDPRISVFSRKKNVGYVIHLNKGIALARGKYIARMDADDISMRNRFEEQLNFMESNPEIGVCGSCAQVFGEQYYLQKSPLKDEDIRIRLLNGTPIIHPTAFIRASVLERFHIRYKNRYLYTEDFAFWIELSKVTKMANLAKVLLSKRMHKNSVGVIQRDRQKEIKEELKQMQIESFLNRTLSRFEIDFISEKVDFAKLKIAILISFIEELEWANQSKKLYSPVKFKAYLSNKVIRNLYRNTKGKAFQSLLAILVRNRAFIYFDRITREELNFKLGRLVAIRP